jgi:hypothetical protein
MKSFTALLGPAGLMLLFAFLLIAASAMVTPENAADAFFGMPE